MSKKRLPLAVPSPCPEEPALALTTIPNPAPDHQAKIDDAINRVREVVEAIDGFAYAPPARRREIAAAAARVSDDALDALAQACDKSEVLATAGMLTGPEIRNLLAIDNAYRYLIRELEVLLRAGEDTLTENRAILSRRAMRAIKIGRSLDLRVAGARETVVPHLTAVEEALKRRKKSKQEKEVAKAIKAARQQLADSKSPSPIPAPASATDDEPDLEDTPACFKAGRDL